MDPKHFGVMDPHGAGSGLGFQIGLMQNPNVPRLIGGVPVRPSDLRKKREAREKEEREAQRRTQQQYLQYLLGNAGSADPQPPMSLLQIMQGQTP